MDLAISVRAVLRRGFGTRRVLDVARVQAYRAAPELMHICYRCDGPCACQGDIDPVGEESIDFETRDYAAIHCIGCGCAPNTMGQGVDEEEP